MSLINQMLRDLEQRKSDKDQHPVNIYQAAKPLHQAINPSQIILALSVFIALVCGATLRPQLSRFFGTDTLSHTVAEAVTVPANISPIQPESAPITATETTPELTPPVTMAALTTQTTETNTASEAKHTTLLSALSALSEAIKNRRNAEPMAETAGNSSLPANTNKTMHWQSPRTNSVPKVKDSKLYPVQLQHHSIQKKIPIPEIVAISPTTLAPQTAAPLHQEQENILDYRLTQAKTLISQEQTQAALALLANTQPNAAKKETYLALVAAAQQQGGSTKQASETYQQLLSTKPNKAEYWLGLAMAQEKNGDINAAREAYAQALNKNSLNAQVIDYIKQRQSALNSE